MPKEPDAIYGGNYQRAGKGPDMAGIIVVVTAVAIFLIGVIFGMGISALLN